MSAINASSPRAPRVVLAFAACLTVAVSAAWATGTAAPLTPAAATLAASDGTRSQSHQGVAAAGLPQRWVLFERYVSQGAGSDPLKRLFLVRPDGSGERPLLRTAPPGKHVVHGDWSPDGRLVVFEVLEATGDAPRATVWVVGVDGRHPRLIASCGAQPCRQYSYPAWSPDGREISMLRYGGYSDGSCCTSQVVVMKVRPTPSGSVAPGRLRVVASFRDDDVKSTYDAYYRASWAPGGKRLVFTVEQYSAEEPWPLLGTRLAVVGTGRGPTRPRFLTRRALMAADPSWNPRREIAFSTYGLGTFQTTREPSNVYTIRADGSRLRQLTDASKDGSYRIAGPVWTPGGRGILVTIARASDGSQVDRVDLAYLGAPSGAVHELGVYGAGGRLQPKRRCCW